LTVEGDQSSFQSLDVFRGRPSRTNNTFSYRRSSNFGILPRNQTRGATSVLNQIHSQTQRQDLLTGGRLSDIDDSDLRSLELHLSAYSTQCLRSGNLEASEHCIRVSADVDREIANRNSDKPSQSQNSCDHFEDVQARQRADRLCFNSEWDSRECRLKQERDDQRQKFEEECVSDFPLHYRNTSTGLLQQKQLELIVIRIRDPLKTKHLSREIEGRAQAENATRNRRLKGDYRSRKRQLLAKQHREIEVMQAERRAEL
jgi:hypothetical protein